MMKIIAHRSGTDRYPEQSMASMRYSLSLGADYVETDIRFTMDGVPVICHDPNTQRVFGPNREVCDMTAEEFRTLRYKEDPSMGSYTLKELFESGLKPLLLHCKKNSPGELDCILSLIRGYDNARGIVLGLQTTQAVTQTRAFDPAIRTLAFMPELDELEAFCATGTEMIRLWESWVSQERIDRIHRAQKMCWVMSGNPKNPGYTDPANLRKWRGMGVDGVLINQIQPLTEWLRR